jgi:hypothetical protein
MTLEKRLRSTLASIRSHPTTRGPTGDPSWESGLLAIATAMLQADIELKIPDALIETQARAALMAQFQSMVSASPVLPAD